MEDKTSEILLSLSFLPQPDKAYVQKCRIEKDGDKYYICLINKQVFDRFTKPQSEYGQMLIDHVYQRTGVNVGFKFIDDTDLKKQITKINETDINPELLSHITPEDFEYIAKLSALDEKTRCLIKATIDYAYKNF